MAMNIRGLWKCTMTLSLSVLGLSQPIQAHDIWMTSDSSGGQKTAAIVYGDLVGPVLADKGKIVSLELQSPAEKIDLSTSLTEGLVDGHPVYKTTAFSAPKGSVLALAYDNGYWIRPDAKGRWANTSKLLMPAGVESHWAVKWGKTLLGPGAYTVVVHSRLEITALKDPYSIPAGGKLPVRLDLDGKPFVGAKIAYTDGLVKLPDDQQPTATTGDDGIAQIPLARKGPCLLTTDIKSPSHLTALVDTDALYASLSFDTLK